MLNRFALAALLCLPLPLQAQTPPQPAPAESPAALPRVTLQTSEGPIVIELDTQRAPITAANFLRYVDQKRLDGTAIYRAMKIGDGQGLIQGGAQGDPKRVLPPIAHEPTSVTGILHGPGTVSMARYAPGSATADFFITLAAMPSFDASPGAAGDSAGFAAFGHVVEGMDVVRRILDAPTSPTEGEGAMRGQMLSPPVRILSARRAALP